MTLRLTILHAERLVNRWWRGEHTTNELEMHLAKKGFYNIRFSGATVHATLSGVEYELQPEKLHDY